MTEPTGYTALDLVGFTDKGTYNAATAYVKNDLVHYSGDIWRCLIDDTTNITPVEGTNWTLFIEAPTNAIEGIIAPVETNPATDSYAVGRQFIYNDALYEVIVAITAGDALVTYEDDPTNANLKLADPVETQVLEQKTQMQTLTNQANAIVNVYGAKNILPTLFEKYKVYNTLGTWNNNVYTYNSLTFTVNADGSVTVNGTSSEEGSFYFDSRTGVELQGYNGKIINGLSANDTFGLRVVMKSSPWTNYAFTTTVEDTLINLNGGIPNDSTVVNVDIYFANGKTFNNVKVEPMIRDARIADSTYEPYAMTNQQLTNRKLVVTSGIVTSDQTTVSAAMADLYSKIEAVTSSLSAGQILVLKRVSIAQTRAADIPITFAHHNLNDVIYATANEVNANAAVLANFVIYADSGNNLAFACIIDGTGATFSNALSNPISGTSSITYDIVECV